MGASPKELVERFYNDVWNRADESVARDILDVDLRFRGSLGSERRGREAFIEYVRSIHRALGNYTCTIEELIANSERAAARIVFKVQHRAPLFGIEATGREIAWAGAAFFRIEEGRIAEIWVLGDVDSVKQQLGIGASIAFSSG